MTRNRSEDVGGAFPQAAENVPGATLYSRMGRRSGSAPRFTRALPEQTRAINRKAVLQCLYASAGLSRADLAREVGLTRVTISDVVAELINEGLIIELGTRGGSRPGKPATMLDINRTGLAIIGVDLSGAETFHGVVTDLDGTVLERREVSITGAKGDAAVRTTLELVDALIAAAPVEVVGIGVGSPGIVDQRGAVLVATNLDWMHVPLRALIARHTGRPVAVVNDANAAALGESFFGGATGDVMLVRIGSGVGAGLVIDGQQVYGSRSAAGEIGHVVVGTDGGRTCSCGKSGCLETWVAIPYLRADLEAATDDDAREHVLAEAGRRLAIICAPIAAALNLNEIVIAGPADVLGDTFYTTTARTLRERTLDDFHGDVNVTMSTLGDDSIVLGAAAMVLAKEVGVS